MTYELNESPNLCYDCDWHRGHDVTLAWLGWPAVFCRSCAVIAHLDLVAKHITTDTSFKAREPE